MRMNTSGNTIPQIPLLFSRCLKVFEVRIPDVNKDIHWVQALISYFPNACPEMEHIRLSAYPPTHVGYVIDIRPITRFSHLRSFMCDLQIEDLDTALQLAQLPKLEVLSLDFRRPHFPHLAPPRKIVHPCIFPCLKSLTCTQSPEFIQASRLPALQSFTIKHVDGLRDSLNALREHCTPDLMRRVTIDCPEKLKGLSFPKDMQGLLDLHALEHVSISGFGWGLGDDALETIAVAWPNLKTLLVRDASRSKPTTLFGLVPLVRHCPDLASISVNLSFHQPSISQRDLPEIGCSNLHLETVHFQDSYIEGLESDAVAAFLSHLLPNLRRINLYHWGPVGRPPSSIQKWSRVEKLLKVSAGAHV